MIFARFIFQVWIEIKNENCFLIFSVRKISRIGRYTQQSLYNKTATPVGETLRFVIWFYIFQFYCD